MSFYFCPPDRTTPCLWSEGCAIGFCQRQSNAEHSVKETPIKISREFSDSLQSVLTERGARYGDWTDHSRIAEQIADIMQFSHQEARIERDTWTSMAPFQRQALRVIADKIARILNGDPNYDDNWRDISGYATLVLERLPNQAPIPNDPVSGPFWNHAK